MGDDPEDASPSLGSLLRGWRDRALLSQEQLAARAGVHVRTVRRLETDAVERPRNTSILCLAEALGLDAQEQAMIIAAAHREGERAAPAGVDAPPVWHVVPRQLPVGVTGFAGRADTLTELDRRLGAGPRGICVVSGTAGVGKTALVLHWAHLVRERFEDGELYVNLQGFGPADEAVDPRDALLAFLEAMGVPPQRIPEDLPARSALYRTTLAGRRVLVVLDNARDAEQARWLLPGGADCAVVITSRRQLSSLITEEGAGLISLDVLTPAESHELLAHRLGRHRVEADQQATDAIIAACARLPLALAIAAGHAVTRPSLPLDVLAADLRPATEDLGRLTTRDSATSLRAVLSRSYALLPDDVARLFRLLAVHPGPDITPAAVASLAGVDPAQGRRLLDALLDASLVTEVAHGRYAFHDLLRAFAHEIANETDEPARAARRVIEHYLHTAYEAALLLDVLAEWMKVPEAASPGVRAEEPADHRQALAWFQAERAVLLAVLRQAMAGGLYAPVIQLVSAVQDWLLRQGHWQEYVDYAHLALEAAVRLGDERAQAAARRMLLQLSAERDGLDQARIHFRHVMALAREAGDLAEEGFALFDMALACLKKDLPEEALRYAEAALTPLGTVGLAATEARVLNVISWCWCLVGDYEQGLRVGGKALAMADELGDRSGQGIILDTVGYIHHQRGAHDTAIAHYRRALALCRELGHRHAEGEILLHLGDARHATGDHTQAERSWRLSLAILQALKHPAADQARARLRDHFA